MTNKEKTPASAPCSLHQWQGGGTPTVAADVSAWRAQERKRLKALGDARSSNARQLADSEIAARLDREIVHAVASLGKAVQDVCLAVYWPLQREPDLRPWYAQAAARDLQLALPAVTERDAPLTFRQWSPGSDLVPDLLGIPAATGREVSADLLITPCAGFDEHCYRLGNGGGYYDRTMAVLPGEPILIGVAYEDSRLRSIYPQPHDVAMQVVITETAVRRAEPAGR